MGRWFSDQSLPAQGPRLLRRLCGVVLAAALWLSAGVPAFAQRGAPAIPEDPAERAALFERWLDAAKSGPPPVRPQAANRLVSLGEEAAGWLAERFGEDLQALAEQGPETVEVLGRFADGRLDGLLWAVISERDFPWRPAAMRALAQGANDRVAGGRADEAERWRPGFLYALYDPLAAVRQAALFGLEALGWTVDWDPDLDSRPSVRARLADEDDRVRRTAALLLDAWGEPASLAWPLADLARDDRWFELDPGRAARHDARRLLERRLGDLGEVRAELDPNDPGQQGARADLAVRIAARAGLELSELPRLPQVARPPLALPPAVVGLELRSCRRGEWFVAVGRDDVLRLGLGNPAELPLAEGTARRLAEALTGALEALGEERDFGRPGCDLEAYRLVLPDGSLAHLRLHKGPEPVPDLRPAPLAAVAAELVAAVAEAHRRLPAGSDPRLADLPERLAEALTSVGGPLPPR